MYSLFTHSIYFLWCVHNFSSQDFDFMTDVKSSHLHWIVDANGSVFAPLPLSAFRKLSSICTIRAPVFGWHQFFGTSEHYGKAHGSLLYGWMNYNYTACCWFPTSSNISKLPSQFWQIRFESYWLHCSKCRILVLLWYHTWHSGFWIEGWARVQLLTKADKKTSLLLEPFISMKSTFQTGKSF